MTFDKLITTHSLIDRARSVALDAHSTLSYAASLASDAGNDTLAEQLHRLSRETLALDFTIPGPQG